MNKVLVGLLVICVMTAAGSAFAATRYENSLAAYWKFDDGSGTAAIDSAGTNNASLLDGPAWATGKYEGALSFDGSNDCAKVNSDAVFDITQAVTLQAWVNINVPTNYGTVIGRSGFDSPVELYEMEMHQGKPLLYINGGALASATVLDSGTWYLVTATYDANGGENNMRIYVNGSLDTQTSRTGNMLTRAYDVSIGRYKVTDTYVFNGLIDDVAVWNRALDANEIASIYDVGVEKYEQIMMGLNDPSAGLDMGYTTSEIAQLVDLYNMHGDPVQLGGLTWSYVPGDLPEQGSHTIGDAYVGSDGKYYIYLGSGLAGAPELPAGILPLLGLIVGGSAWVRRRAKREGRM